MAIVISCFTLPPTHTLTHPQPLPLDDAHPQIESYGVQTRLPQEWPRECVLESEVWVLPSSSGRSALTHEQRSTPYRQLAERLHSIPWPLEDVVHAEPKHEDVNAEDIDSGGFEQKLALSHDGADVGVKIERRE